MDFDAGQRLRRVAEDSADTPKPVKASAGCRAPVSSSSHWTVHTNKICPLPAEETGSLPHVTFITAHSRFCDYINYAA
jgi:hypothetical protein